MFKRTCLITMLLTLFYLFSSSCKKNGETNEIIPTNCGCDNPIRTTITDSSNLIATIEYNKYYNDYNFKNKFTIVYVERNCSNCVHTMFICNEAILPQQVLDLKRTNQILRVKFAGHLKPLCIKVPSPADYTYENITLTNIAVQ